MGQHADDFLEQVIDQENLRSNFHDMMPIELFEAGLVDELGFTEYTPNEKRTMEYLKSFRDFYKKNRFLSDKQINIVDKNYRGGSSAFIRSIIAQEKQTEIDNRVAEEYHINCMDCGKFVPKELWISKDHPKYKGAECSECLAAYESAWDY